ncbi:MAG: SpoVG family protein [Eubacterium sp.]|nr:SpoVG family protein [Eubacterium sp.]
MLLTQIKIKNIPISDRLRGFAEVVFDNQFAVHDIKIIKRENDYLIAMPSKKIGNSENFSDIVHPINRETREVFEKMLLVAYEECINSKKYSMCFELVNGCNKVNVFEQDISDFVISEQYENMSNSKDIVLEKDEDSVVIPISRKYSDDRDVQVLPIYNYIPGVSFHKDNRNPNLKEKDFWKKLNFEWESKHLTNSDILLLSWINKLQYATSKNIFALMNAGIIEKSENYIFSKKNVSNRLSNTFLKNLNLIDSYIFADTTTNRSFKTSIYLLSNYGYKVLRTLKFDVNTTPVLSKLKSISYIKRDLAQNEWFCNIAEQYKDYLNYYDISTIMDNENYIEARANVLVYLKINEQPFFAEAFRNDLRLENEMHNDVIYNKVYRLSLLAEGYKDVTIKMKNANMKKQPIIVIIAENEEHCKKLYNIFKEIKLNVKIIYAYDTLISHDINNAHFEFVDDEMIPYDIKKCIIEE